MATQRRSRRARKNPTAPETPTDVTATRQATCPSLGSGTKLGYEIGTDPAGTPCVRLTSNAGGGFFSQEWIALPAIQAALDAWPEEWRLTSYALAPLFHGKSANNPSFLAAVLVAEGVLRVRPDRKRYLERADPVGGFGDSGDSVDPPAKKAAARRQKTSGSASTARGPKQTPTTPKPRKRGQAR
ncbi:hypothetical protein [Pseudohaliea sp.]|uniref:hypothetical protein n=1 Tax=Pseudohaliea sp. TaxID=2740289 RepID=UPI0032EEAF13